MVCSRRGRRAGQRQRAGGVMLSADLADAERAVIRPLFTRLAGKTRSTRVDDRRTVIDAMLCCR